MENETNTGIYKTSKKGMKPSFYAFILSILSIPLFYFVYKPMIKVDFMTASNEEYWAYARQHDNVERIIWLGFFIILMFLIISIKDYLFNLNTLKIDKNTISLNDKVIKNNQIVSVDLEQGLQGALLGTGTVIIRTTNERSTIAVKYRDNPHAIRDRIVKIMEENNN
jgi:membrane protein YdbS with pleckstrin-like domain